jgi:hypothetical protein
MGLVFIVGILLLLDILDPLPGSLHILLGVIPHSFHLTTNHIINECFKIPQLFLNLTASSFSLLSFLLQACDLCIGLIEGSFKVTDRIELIFQLSEVFQKFVVSLWVKEGLNVCIASRSG